MVARGVMCPRLGLNRKALQSMKLGKPEGSGNREVSEDLCFGPALLTCQLRTARRRAGRWLLLRWGRWRRGWWAPIP